ncbi:MAG: hypothetical protein M3R02_19500, partial [Chloroflexota bacterium]|nr:hypothetical protein [Chloroflexota bacterium]
MTDRDRPATATEEDQPMHGNRRIAILHAALARHRAGRIGRRQALRILGGLGITGAAAIALVDGRTAGARTGGAGGHG